MAGKQGVFNPSVHSSGRESGDVGINPYSENVSALYDLGTRFELGTRVFYYAENASVALAAGRIVQSSLIESNGDVTDMVVDEPGIGATEMEVTNGANTAITLNEFAMGWLHVNDDTGEGYAYQIRGNDAIATSVAGTIFLYDAVQVALGANATVSLTHSEYKNVIVAPAPQTAMLIGGSVAVITADYFFWLQTWGPFAVLQDGTTNNWVEGFQLRNSEDDIGALADWDVSDDNDSEMSGVAIHVNADGEHGLTFLKISR